MYSIENVNRNMSRKILMVSLGNISCSPIAEAIMAGIIEEAGLTYRWYVESAALADWHCDYRPDERALTVLENHGITCLSRARQITRKDFDEFDYIFGMDKETVNDLKRLAPANCKAQIQLLGDYGLLRNESSIANPYIDIGSGGFELLCQKCEIACEAFLKEYIEFIREIDY
uniref:Low molecular weight phosphotyrosine protein phosphatase n=1 Tax=Glossina brevipalpis TaxID=37001 RepID=A0A1A9WNU1_9MUSC